MHLFPPFTTMHLTSGHRFPVTGLTSRIFQKNPWNIIRSKDDILWEYRYCWEMIPLMGIKPLIVKILLKDTNLLQVVVSSKPGPKVMFYCTWITTGPHINYTSPGCPSSHRLHWRNCTGALYTGWSTTPLQSTSQQYSIVIDMAL